MRFDPAGGLAELDQTGKGKPLFMKGTAIDTGADGIIAWGRWVDGQSKVNDASGNGKGNIASLQYFAYQASPTQAVAASFGSFASTAATVTNAGTLVATGTSNGSYGTLNINFPAASGGVATYGLTVPVAGQTFTLAGIGVQTSPYGFAGVSLISSTGSACALACTGSLGNNVSVIGLVGGAQGNRAGVTYGFNSGLGNVSGVIVFKR